MSYIVQKLMTLQHCIDHTEVKDVGAQLKIKVIFKNGDDFFKHSTMYAVSVVVLLKNRFNVATHYKFVESTNTIILTVCKNAFGNNINESQLKILFEKQLEVV